MNYIDRIGGLGSNNTMSLWTWPWTGSRKMLKEQRNNRQNRTDPLTRMMKWIFDVRVYFFLAAIGISLLFWQTYDADDLNNFEVETASDERKLNLAVLVAGATQRYLFDSFVDHVARSPSNSVPVNIDYFAILTLQAGPAYRQDLGYMGHLAGRDEIFDRVLAANEIETQSIDSIRDRMMSTMTQALARVTTTNTVSVKALRLLNAIIEDDPVLDVARKREQNRTETTNGDAEEPFNLFRQYPMMDLRQKALKRTKEGNRNIIRLFLALESLWKTEFMAADETQHYDYVLILRDDTLWLDDFDLHKVIATNPTADAYVLSCDARDPKMLPPEINDHGILIRREKADIMGAYVSAMVNSDLQKCHESVTEWLGKDRGCNSEMILRYILESNGIDVQLVPQSVLPFERSVVIDGKSSGGEKNFYCLHKMCQSVDAPLEIPSEIQGCKSLKFDE